MKIASRTFCALIALGATGCSAIGIGPSNNTGLIEYRVAEPVPVTDALIAKKTGNTQLTKAKLIRHYSGSRNQFNTSPANDAAKDVYSIILEQAILGGFIGEFRFKQPAEIAILANVFEFDSTAAATSPSRFYEFPEISGPRTNEDGTATDVSSGMKLIYFSPDVYLKQPLNFSALPIVAPSRYSGRPIGIQIAILELDRMSGPLKSLLGELADLGQASNTALAVPGLTDVALKLGSSLLSGDANNDDIIFETKMVLYPQQLSTNVGTGALPTNETATFQPGRYVILRKERRKETIKWDDYTLDHNTARLFRTDDKSGKVFEHRDDTYLTVNIVKHPPGTQVAHYAHRTLGQLDQILTAAERTDGSASLQVITENLGARVKDVRSQARLEDLELKWTLLKTAMEKFDAQRYPTDNGTVQHIERDSCELADESILRPPMVEARLKVEEAAKNFRTAYDAAIRTSTTSPEPELQDTDRDALISRIAQYVVPRDESLDTKFGDASAFKTAYISGGTGKELGAAMTAVVEKIPRKMSCADLEARGWKS